MEMTTPSSVIPVQGCPLAASLARRPQDWYYLAVFGLDTTPTSGNGTTPDHYIAPNTSSPFTSVLSASGLGGASPLSGWAPVLPGDVVTINEDYRLRLSGVSVVPEPETYAMLLAGLGLMGAIARRRKTSIGQ